MRAPSAENPLGPFSGPAKAALVLEILVAYARVRWSLGRAGLPATLAAARTSRPDHAARPSLPGETVLGARLGRAVVRTLRLLPTDSRCLMRSLVLTSLLARRGLESAVVIGVVVDPEFAAHAWVERGDVPLLPTEGSGYARLVRL
jgi:Transglutaminase-like superfamily